jgi:hypothetical protein
MSTAHLIGATSAIVAAIGCIFAANVIFFQILDEVNAKRLQEQLVGFSFVNVKGPDVLREHARFFPNSQKRRRMHVCAGVGFTLLLLTFLSRYL